MKQKKKYKIIVVTAMSLLLIGIFYYYRTKPAKILQSLLILNGGTYSYYEKKMQEPSFSINQLFLFFIVKKIGFKKLANLWFIGKTIQIISAKK
jgi:hypothetical protein